MRMIENGMTSSEPFVVIGARSSVFLPFHKLGLVIVDEEHEASYKQFDPSPRYHARDTAIVLGKTFAANVLLGSATRQLKHTTMLSPENTDWLNCLQDMQI